jgi:transposase
MAQDSVIRMGVDTARDWLDIHRSDTDRVERIDNTPAAITACLEQFRRSQLSVAIESTGSYHQAFCEEALQRGCQVYLVNARHLYHYRQALNVRAKTDAMDARLLCRYLTAEEGHLQPLKLRDKRQIALWSAIKRRAQVVQQRTALRQSLTGLDKPLARQVTKMLAQMTVVIDALQDQALALARALGWDKDLKILESITGVGELTALGLTAMIHRGEFASVDSFIAFIGLDVRVNESGQHKGKGRVTKHGDPEIRRLLFNAAMAARRHDEAFRQRYLAYLAKGRSTTEALLIIARSIARIAFALLKKGCAYDPQHRLKKACAGT